ncbi:sugar-binding transcriptional regulator [Leptolyngbya sp. FACHB-261]|uniref:sugar-binding transcriptional regulator n=1 Tax=Leptolyngbya sp. FACHB-261 TaxID=2692806 RepID=UPI001682C932|nr:sugar-binding transcriptional regulator [Leptolyngbya sp. FACHB-261]MBD2104008.1 sugar-binding transcriptional regulator [Leptolyngbya sp. FACHB-261]
MNYAEDQSTLAVQVARLYYYQGLTTEGIAQELGLSRPKVSRLLAHARQSGLVEIRIHDPQEGPQKLEHDIQQRYGISQVKVVAVPPNSDEEEWLQRVATFTANHLNGLIHSEMVVGLAWGNTLDAISRQLNPKRCTNVDIVQLNGSGNVYTISNFYTSEIYSRFAQNYGARAHFFPVPAFFDYPETKQAMWQERSVLRLIELTERANLLVYSVGAAGARVPSYVYAEGYLEAKDFEELDREGVVGDIATVFFRKDGTYQDIPLNKRATGPNLSLFQQANHALCVVSGLGKARGLHAALIGRFMNELIVDEPTARALLQF